MVIWTPQRPKKGEMGQLGAKKPCKIRSFAKLRAEKQCELALQGQNTVQNEGQNQKVMYFTAVLRSLRNIAEKKTVK